LEAEKGKEIMPRLGMRSQDQLRTLDERLQKLLIISIQYIDFSIVEGLRTLERQKELFKTGKSKTMDSKHLINPKTGKSDAVDIAPYPYPDLKNPDPKVVEMELRQVYFLIGVIKGIALRENTPIRIGADWNSNNDIRDDAFQDAWHIEGTWK
jgi:peptidoglycan L-alanyl-D-glutamate endopeptidase CwlK